MPASGLAQNAPTDGQRLKTLSLEELGRVEVVTTTKEPVQLGRTPAAVFVITQEDIRRSGATTIAEALRLAPGVQVGRIDSNKWAVGIRGFQSYTSRQALVLIDGRSVYTPLFAGVYWETQDTFLDDIERIEVIRGPGGTIWGANAVNGIVNIVTKSAVDTQGALASVSGGNVEQASAAFRYGGQYRRRLNYRVYGKGFGRGPQFHPDQNDSDRWRMGQAGFRTDWQQTARDLITVQGDAYGGVAGHALAVASYTAPFTRVVRDNANLSGGNVLARWSRVLSSDSDFQLLTYFDVTNRRDINAGELRNTFDIDFTHSLRIQRHRLIWGLGGRVSDGNFTQTVPTVDFIPRDKADTIYSGFLSDEIDLLPERLSLTIGSKILRNNYTGFELQPSARLLWTPAAQHSFWASVTRAVRTPSRIEEGFEFTAFLTVIPPGTPLFLRLIGDGNFLPEKLTAYEAGYRGYATPQFWVDVATFYHRHKDLLSVEPQPIVLETSPPPPHLVLPIPLRNRLFGSTAGVEIAPAWSPVPWLRLRGSYSFLDTGLKAMAGSRDTSTVRQNTGPRHQVTARIALDLSRRAEIDVGYRFIDEVPSPAVPAYSTADARVGWRLNDSVELSLVGQNLLQPNHPEFGGNPGPLVGIRRGVYGRLTFTHAQR